MLTIKGLQVGLLYWQPDGEVVLHLTSMLEQLGCTVHSFLFDAALPNALDVVMACGPMGSLVPLINQLHARPSAQRPAFVLLMTEQLPNPNLPEWLRRRLSALRSQAERLAFRPNGASWQLRPWLQCLTKKANRYRYYGDLFWLQKEGLLSVLVVGSRWTAARLGKRGFTPFVPPRSYRPEWGADLNLSRDIPVLWLGKIATRRRRRLLTRIQAELETRSVELLMVDGQQNSYVFGRERTMLLNRTKIVLNLLREPWDDNSMRFTLSAYNNALIVTEPTLPHTDFIPGVHLVEAPIERMADAICYYLAHDAERQQITAQAYRLVTEGVSRSEGLVAILEQAMAALPSRRPRESTAPAPLCRAARMEQRP